MDLDEPLTALSLWHPGFCQNSAKGTFLYPKELTEQDQAAEPTDAGIGMKVPAFRSTGCGFSTWLSGSFPHWALRVSSGKENSLGYPGTEPGMDKFFYLQGGSWDVRIPLHSFGPASLTKISGSSVTVNSSLGNPRKEGKVESFYRGKLVAQGKGVKSTLS